MDVLITGGRIEGSEETHAGASLAVFRGIPYAEPPVGPRRWQPPEAVRPWAGTRQAIQFGPAAPQSAALATALPIAAMEAGPTDEDCLTLNLWCPTGARDRPVMVWLHGGSFMSGSSSMPSYDGARLAVEGGVIVVSVNYRVGALGFAPVAGHANLGLLDQILALTWVRNNVAEFGGDPDRITVFGESAGAGSILHLLAAPAAAGLFRRAIAQSGATNLTLSGAEAEDIAHRFVTILGADPRTASVERILEAQGRVLADVAGTIGLMPYHPTVDGAVVTCTPAEAVAAGMSSGVDLLLGTTADEMRLFLDPATWTLEEARLAKRAVRYLATFGVAPDAATQLFAAYDDLPTPTDRWAALRTDAEMWLPTLAIADAHPSAFVYRFDWPAGPPNEHLGACHGIDIPFTFATLDRCGWGSFVGATEDGRAHQLGRALRAAWVEFARTGDTSTELVGTWPAYAAATRPTMLFGPTISLAEDPRGHVRQAWASTRAV
jgi:para-nitrobenzyl esterase